MIAALRAAYLSSAGGEVMRSLRSSIVASSRNPTTRLNLSSSSVTLWVCMRPSTRMNQSSGREGQKVGINLVAMSTMTTTRKVYN